MLIHRNTPIHLTPSEDAPYLQYRTPERQADFDERLAKEEEERREKRREQLAEREERDRERAERIRKRRRKLKWKRRQELRERDEARAAERRYDRAAATLRGARRRARNDLLEAPHRAWIPFRVVDEADGWLELSPVSRVAEPPHCYRNNFGEVDRLEATFWVKEDAPAMVTTGQVRIGVWNGTEVILKPGVAVAPVDEDTYRVVVDGFDMELDIPPNSVGKEYLPSRPFEAPMTDTVFNPIGFVEGHFRLARDRPFPFNPYRKMYVTGTLVVGSRFFVTTQTPCGEFTMLGHEELLEPVGRRGATRLSGASESVEPPFARAGAQSYLPDGTKFATARVDFPLGDETQEVKGRQCYRSAVWGDTDAAVTRSVELCFETADIVTE